MGSAGRLTVAPMAIHCGAMIDGVDLAGDMGDEAVAGIREALLRWKVVFFRGQDLDHAGHVAFARRFGACTPAHVVYGGSDPEHPEIYSVAKFRTANANREQSIIRPWSGWHTDITAAVNPPGMSILRGVTVPPYGGDTLWTNLAAAYEGLSEPMQRFLDGLRGIHRFDVVNVHAATEAGTGGTESVLEAEHPLVRVHPETGEKILFASPSFLKSIVGLTPSESLHLREMLWEHIVRPEFTVRFRWEPGSVAFWDNRATAHLAPRDIFSTDFERQFYRVTLMGDVPQGPDGRASTLLKGKPIAPVP